MFKKTATVYLNIQFQLRLEYKKKPTERAYIKFCIYKKDGTRESVDGFARASSLALPKHKGWGLQGRYTAKQAKF